MYQLIGIITLIAFCTVAAPAGAIGACSQALALQHGPAQELLVTRQERHRKGLQAEQTLRLDCTAGDHPACRSSLAHEISYRHDFVMLEGQPPALSIFGQGVMASAQGSEPSSTGIMQYVAFGIILAVIVVGARAITTRSIRYASRAFNREHRVALGPAGTGLLFLFGGVRI